MKLFTISNLYKSSVKIFLNKNIAEKKISHLKEKYPNEDFKLKIINLDEPKTFSN